jgi:GNAT superfamily N-acetyltransferase
MDVRGRVDSTWAEVFGIDVHELRVPAVRVVIDAPGLRGYRGCYLLRLYDGCCVAAHPAVGAQVRAAVGGATVAQVFDPAFVGAWAAELGGRVLGPSWHGYARGSDLRMPADDRVRRLGREDDEAVAELRAAVGEADWAEGGFGHRPDVLWGVYEGGHLAAAGNMTDYDGFPADVGLVTRPDARGKGLATAVAASMCAAAAPDIPLLRYRALTTNTASLRVARRLGFVGHGANIAVRLDPEPTATAAGGTP